jgi:hypothetical protein
MRDEDLFAAASAGVRCEAGASGEIIVFYNLFRFRDSFDDQYWKLFEGNVEPQGGAKGDNGCADGVVGEGTYNIRPQKSVAGRVLCFRDDEGNAVVAWTHDRLLTLGYALGDKPKPLWRWWTAKGGLCTPEPSTQACS